MERAREIEIDREREREKERKREREREREGGTGRIVSKMLPTGKDAFIAFIAFELRDLLHLNSALRSPKTNSRREHCDE